MDQIVEKSFRGFVYIDSHMLIGMHCWVKIHGEEKLRVCDFRVRMWGKQEYVLDLHICLYLSRNTGKVNEQKYL